MHRCSQASAKFAKRPMRAGIACSNRLGRGCSYLLQQEGPIAAAWLAHAWVLGAGGSREQVMRWEFNKSFQREPIAGQTQRICL